MNENNRIKLRDGRIVGWAEYGDAGGRPLVFFHGWPSSRFAANVVDEAAKALNVRVVSPDRPGYGLSAFQTGRTLLDWPDDVLELVDALNIKKFAVMGVSGGGPYAAACGYKIADRLTNVGIVVGLSPQNTRKEVFRGMSLIARSSWRLYQRFPFLVDVASSYLWLQAKKVLPMSISLLFAAKKDREFVRRPAVKARILRTMREAFRQGHRGAACDLRLYTTDWGFDIRDIRARVFLWYGEDDKNVSVEMGKYYAAHILNSTLTLYPHEGHRLLEQHAEEILKALA